MMKKKKIIKAGEAEKEKDKVVDKKLRSQSEIRDAMYGKDNKKEGK